MVNLTHCHSITASRTVLSKDNSLVPLVTLAVVLAVIGQDRCIPDDDNGALIFNPSKPGTSALVTGKISLHGARYTEVGILSYWR